MIKKIVLVIIKLVFLCISIDISYKLVKHIELIAINEFMRCGLTAFVYMYTIYVNKIIFTIDIQKELGWIPRCINVLKILSYSIFINIIWLILGCVFVKNQYMNYLIFCLMFLMIGVIIIKVENCVVNKK